MDNAPNNNDDAIVSDVSSQTTPPVDNVGFNTPPPKKSRLPLIISLIIIALVLAGGGVYYFLFMNKSATNTESAQKSQVAVKKADTLTAKSLVEKIKGVVKGEQVPVDNRGFDDNHKLRFYIPYEQTNGRAYYNGPETVFGVGFKDKADIAAVRSLLASSNLASTDNRTYKSNDIECDFVDFSNDSFEPGVGCADTSSYEAAAKVIDPLYNAYLAANPDTEGLMLSFGMPVIKDSVGGYKKASINRSNGEGTGWIELYYQAPGEDWKFFLGLQAPLECDKYNTVALKKSFIGDSCYDANGLSTVKAD